MCRACAAQFLPAHAPWHMLNGAFAQHTTPCNLLYQVVISHFHKRWDPWVLCYLFSRFLRSATPKFTANDAGAMWQLTSWFSSLTCCPASKAAVISYHLSMLITYLVSIGVSGSVLPSKPPKLPIAICLHPFLIYNSQPRSPTANARSSRPWA